MSYLGCIEPSCVYFSDSEFEFMLIGGRPDKKVFDHWALIGDCTSGAGCGNFNEIRVYNTVGYYPGIGVIVADGNTPSGPGGSNNHGGPTTNGTNGIEELKPLFGTQEKLEVFVTNRILVPGMMIGGGLYVATVSAQATILAFLAGPEAWPAIPFTLTGVAGGAALAFEGGYYGVKQQIYVPPWSRH